jgi:hypothetical protein
MAKKKEKERKNKRGGCVSGGSIRPPHDEPEPKPGIELEPKKARIDREIREP